MKKQEKQTDKRRQSSDSRSSRGPFVLSVDGEIRQTPSNRQTTSTPSNRQTEQTSSITPSNRQTISTPSNRQTEQTSSITPSNRQTTSTPSNHEEFRPHKRQKSEKKQKHKQKKGKRLTKRSYDNESSSEDESSSDESEMDEKKARAEMKTILKTVPKTLDMNYNETFTSGANISRTIQKKIRRMKSAKSLYANNNSEISKYNKEELLKILKNRKYHSPEISESDDDPVNQNKRIICVYDLSWRSDELKMLLRDILDPHSFTIQIARLTRERNYDDELQSYDHPHPPNAPEWSYIEQIDQVYDTEIEDVNLGSKTPVYGDNEDSIVGNMPVYGDNEDSIMYNTDEEYAHGESSTTGMIREAILEADSQQKDKNKKIETHPGLGLRLFGYHGLFDTELWSFGFILASEARTNRTLRYFARILNLQVFRPDIGSTGIVPSALGLGIGKFQGISLDIGDFSVGFFD
ncbi:hypothetical protein GLOIN_2v1773969 [Rhizophagus irregularis DAOM 181602=DAOM 197198]|uniref:Uncharacterized protein n=1 Tax=Rhizophagus irregularis (strain DAOM 181602 / DAOM 197198 / MUCL 43194) TaxID=747089 RepID=A0A2P4Q399_RHIID|nr:hypothetical protein GLOIN_2v1773969 [Rhizophagus irregularis DAOM 181602=DAOM 197198]POG72129.1 hypothetical protein GLOIN_2v1773969 [Rhizophagus irregularis DAOM 181602=DAOM 197198]|eukprot:XP_025178995.1 hypothetical protein GLOIN_2v1773969 [Rhizophagus irregularis DAOM 181602=DAOM 197198]